MIREYTTLLWDLDGTLTNPKIGITKSIQYGLKHIGINETDLDHLTRFIGPPLKPSLTSYYQLNEVQVESVYHKFQEYFEEKGIFENVLYEGIDELLRDLNDIGRVHILATSKPTQYAKKILQHFKLDQYFSGVFGGDLQDLHSDKATVIHAAINDNVTARDKIVMIGDTHYDVLGAKENRIDSIAVLYGFGDIVKLHDSQPAYIAEDINTLRKALLY